MTSIRTATIPVTADPAMLLILHAPDAPISYASIHCDTAQAIRMLRYTLIHLVAEQAGLNTVPTSAAIIANGHTPSDPSDPSHPSNPSDSIPPLRVPKAKPTDTHMRGKPGPKPGTARRRKVDADADLEF